MQTPEETVSRIMGACLHHLWEGRCVRHHSIIRPDNATCVVAQEAADLIRARDAEVRADERGRCSIVHATLPDEALVAELVRRGVLEADEYAEPCDWRCYVVTYDYEECRHVCRRSGPHAEHECVNGHTVAFGPDDDQPERTLRYVTAWETGPDDNHTSDGRCKYPKTCESEGTHKPASADDEGSLAP